MNAPFGWPGGFFCVKTNSDSIQFFLPPLQPLHPPIAPPCLETWHLCPKLPFIGSFRVFAPPLAFLWSRSSLSSLVSILPHRQRSVLMSLNKHPDMRFVQNFTPPDFQAKNFTQSILHNFNSYSDKNTKNEWNGEIYTAGKKFTLPPAVTAWTNLTAAVTCPFVSRYWLCFWILEVLNLKGI